MTSFTSLLQQGNAWLFVPSAILLGALHGLEPGHSKTMMAAFIVAIRGTMTQAVLLGLSATISHTVIVWVIAMAGLYFGRDWNAEASEPYFQLLSGILIIAVALWMLWRVREDQHAHHDHDHHHHHEEAPRTIYVGSDSLSLEVFEEGVPPRFRLKQDAANSQRWPAADVEIETTRPDGARQRFTFIDRGDYLESEQAIPEPHAFQAQLSLRLDSRTRHVNLSFEEHSHTHSDDGEYQDAHERAHASDIERRFAGRQVTTGQIVMFGLTGGLIPCPASITVLLICLQLKKIALGASLVLCFSVGLALTMVASGALAALSVKHVSRRWSSFGRFARKAPYFSGALIALVGLYVVYQGVIGIASVS